MPNMSGSAVGFARTWVVIVICYMNDFFNQFPDLLTQHTRSSTLKNFQNTFRCNSAYTTVPNNIS